ncbi:MAG: Wzz/FepE/Etk N-terminal domain-containing protein [Verrucomicrobiota bacterium]
MSDKKTHTPQPRMTLEDVYFVLFRRKWMILGLSLAGILGALAVCLMNPPQYKSEAELSLSVLEAKPISVPGEETQPMNAPSENIIDTEIDILKSLDLAQQVVQALTPSKILGGRGGGAETNEAMEAAYFIQNGLTVESTPGTSVIHITLQHPDEEIVQPALSEIIDGYFVKHFKMRGGGVFGDFLTNETTRLRGELIETEKQIQQAQSEAGVISTEDSKAAYSSQITKLRDQISGAEEELAERQAARKALTATSGEPLVKISSEQYDAYRRICARLVFLNNEEDDFLTRQGFTEENVLVKEVRGQIADAQKIKTRLEEKYPPLASVVMLLPDPARGTTGMPDDLPDDSVQISALKAKIEFLHSQLNQVWTDATNFKQVEATLSGLEQKRESAEANLRYFTDHLERSRIDDELNDGKVSNISIIQSPTPPLKGRSKKFEKVVGALAVSGILAGLALAFLMELVLDRSVKQPSEIETKLGLPLFISIPDVEKNGFGKHARRLGAGRLLLDNTPGATRGGGTPPGTSIAPWDREHPLRRFYEGLRDRLIVHFEVRNLVHKPKLVAVTSCGHGGGVSSIAAGLAATLSETGDGNVLLVNISGDRGAARQFYRGEPGYSLDQVLETEKNCTLVKANLYTITEQTNGDVLPANLPKKLSALMPKLKASEYDYIIFDMPPVNQTTATARLSGLMDMVLLVIEAEKTNQDVVRRVIKLLAESKANVSTVLNKSRNYIPAKLSQEFLNYV